MSDSDSKRNCIFYGHSMYLQPNALALGGAPFLLFPTGGNQCALVTVSHSPCRMEINQDPVEWSQCPLATDLFVSRRDRP